MFDKFRKDTKKGSFIENKQSSYLDDIMQEYIYAIIQMSIIESRVGKFVSKNNKWKLDLNKSKISVGEHEFDFQYLGVELSGYNMWSWGWQNIIGAPVSSLKLIKELKEKYDYKIFKESNINFTEVLDATTFAKLSCYLAEGNYFYVPIHLTSDKIVYLAINGGPEELYEPIPADNFTNVLANLFSKFKVDQKIAIKALVDFCNATMKDNIIDISGTKFEVSYEGNIINDIVCLD